MSYPRVESLFSLPPRRPEAAHSLVEKVAGTHACRISRIGLTPEAGGCARLNHGLTPRDHGVGRKKCAVRAVSFGGEVLMQLRHDALARQYSARCLGTCRTLYNKRNNARLIVPQRASLPDEGTANDLQCNRISWPGSGLGTPMYKRSKYLQKSGT